MVKASGFAIHGYLLSLLILSLNFSNFYLSHTQTESISPRNSSVTSGTNKSLAT